MSRMFSRRDYHLLDDSDADMNHVQLDPVNDDTGDDDLLIDESENNSLIGRLQQIYLRIPQVNWSICPIKRLANNRCRRTVCDVILCLFCLAVVVTVCLVLGYHTLFILKPAPVIDKSYRAFRIPNHKASLNYGALQNVKRNHTSFSRMKPGLLHWVFGHREQRDVHTDESLRVKREVGGARLSQENGGWDHTDGRDPTGRKRRSIMDFNYFMKSQYYPQWKMQVVFLAKDGENIFTKENLMKVHEIEKRIMMHEQYTDFCFKDLPPNIDNDPAIKAYNGCAPLNSLLTYFFPSKDGNGNVFYDGLGENMDNIDSALKLAMTSTHFYYYVDDKVNTSYFKSQLLRTEVLFGSPLKGFQTPYSNREEQTKKYKEFVVTYIDILAKASTNDLTVLYGGKEIFDYEVEMTFWSDVKLAVYALVAIFLLMLVLTSGSLWLTFWGIVSILLSAPLAIFYYRAVFKVVGLGILNGAAAFVIIGIGVDDVFVFINVFRQANHLKDARARTLYTVKTAGKATFFTSFTTAAAFAANIASMIPAVHDFGLFMSLIVANCWCTVMLIMPPVLYIWYISFGLLEEKLTTFLCSCVRSSSGTNSLSVPEDIARFMDHSHASLTPVSLSREVTQEDVDVQMLSLESQDHYYVDNDDDHDDEMLMVDPDPLIIPELGEEEPKVHNHLGAKLQGLLYHGMALPFIKGRWVILGISFALFCISVGLMTQLHTSTKPPQFFRQETNMQKLLDLKARFSSIDTVQCYYCSAIYSIGQRPSTTVKTQGPPVPTVPFNTTYPRTTASHWVKTTIKEPRVIPITQPKPPVRPPMTTRPNPIPYHHDVITTKPSHGKVIPPQPKSVPDNYDVCKDRDCTKLKERPLLETGATVYVILGVKSFKWSTRDVGHVMSENVGELEFDTSFSSMMNFSSPDVLEGLKQLCSLCKKIAQNTQLVRNGSAQCLPISPNREDPKTRMLQSVEECRDLPQVSYIYGNQQPAHALGSLTNDGSAILWLGFAFESTTSKGKSYFEAYEEYREWERFLVEIKQELDPSSPLQDLFQTSEFWPEVLMEIVAVNSAIYGVVLSMLICMVAVVIFTRHVLLMLVIFVSIVEMVCLVVSMFYVLGWEIGGVEAVSLSILVGSSVDYCVHLVEGYILAAEACPIKDDSVKARNWRTSAAFSHVGVSIISSALTTIIAAIPLTQTTIQPFSKFGQIIAINTSVCIVYSLTVCTALLATIAPAYFKPTLKSLVKSVVGTTTIVGTCVLAMFVMSKAGVDIPGPNGGPLFG